MDELKELKYEELNEYEKRIFDMTFKKIHQDKIARHFNVSRSTLMNKYHHVIASAVMAREEMLRDAQFKAAVQGGNATMLIWLGKNELQQSDMPLGEGIEEVTEVSFKVRRVPKPTFEDEGND